MRSGRATDIHDIDVAYGTVLGWSGTAGTQSRDVEPHSLRSGTLGVFSARLDDEDKYWGGSSSRSPHTMSVPSKQTAIVRSEIRLP